MQSHTGRSIPALLLGALLALGQGGFVAAASPSGPETSAAERTPSTEGTLNVSPPLINVAVEPGGSTAAELTLHAATAQNVSIQIDGLGQEPDGSFESLAAAQDKSPYSGRSMLTLAPQTFALPAGGSQKVEVTVNVPKDAGEGSRYAILDITGTPVSSQNVGIGVELGVSSIIVLADTKQTHAGRIDKLTVGDMILGQPLQVTGTLINTGNSHFGAAPNQVTAKGAVWDSSGQVVASGQVVMTGNSIVPSFGRKFTLGLAGPRQLSDGKYRVEVDADLQDGTILDRVALDFDVSAGAVAGATYAPPQGLPASSGTSSSGSNDELTLIMALLAGLLLGAVVVSAVALRGRRAQGRPVASRSR